MMLHVTLKKQEFRMPAASSERVQKHRTALRESGLRPVQIWVPDTRRVGFAQECRRQSLLLQGDVQEHKTAVWLASAADTEGWQ